MVDENGIVEGKAKIFDEEGFLDFEGSFLNRRRCGKGIEYLSNGKKGRDGEWRMDQLINGVIYDVFLDASGKIFTDTIRQVENTSDLYDLERYSSELKVGNVRVTNSQIKVVKESIINLEIYLHINFIRLDDCNHPNFVKNLIG